MKNLPGIGLKISLALNYPFSTILAALFLQIPLSLVYPSEAWIL